MRSLIENHRVIVCTGSGGVGKTTTSAALGIAAAQMGKRVLVLTIDPARRLATSLGIDDCSADVRVPGQNYPGVLYAGMIDPPQIFADYITRHSKTSEAAQRLFNTVLYQQLSTTLSGSQEFTSLARLHEAASSGAYDLVILDTPPAAYAVDFLLAPQKLNAVFDSSIVSLFMGRSSGFGLAASAWKQGMKMILGTLTYLTGSEFVRNFTDFFASIDGIAPDIRQTNLQAQQLLLDPTTAFVLVSSFDAAKIQEGEAFQDQLLAGGYHLRKVIVNRAWPQWSQLSDQQQQATQQALLAAKADELAACHGQLLDYFRARRTLHARFRDALSVPEMEGEMIGLAALERLANYLLRAPSQTYS